MRAAVEHEIELDVAPAPVRLKLALALGVRRVAAALDDRQIGLQERIADASHQRERPLEAAFRVIIEENAADATLLVAMLQIEILVAPCLEARIQRDAERIERVAANLMEMARVVLVAVNRRQIHAAAEPEDRRFAFLERGEHAHVGVHGRAVRIARMHDERDAERLEAASGELRARRARGGRKGVALHVGKADAAALEKAAAFQNARHAAAAQMRAGLAGPGVGGESGAVEVAERIGDTRLQARQIVAHGPDIAGCVFLLAWFRAAVRFTHRLLLVGSG